MKRVFVVHGVENIQIFECLLYTGAELSTSTRPCE